MEEQQLLQLKETERTSQQGPNTAKLVEKFLKDHSFNDEYDNRGGKPDFEYDDYAPEDTGDMNVPDVPEPVIDFDVPDYTDDPGGLDFYLTV